MSVRICRHIFCWQLVALVVSIVALPTDAKPGPKGRDLACPTFQQLVAPSWFSVLQGSSSGGSVSQLGPASKRSDTGTDSQYIAFTDDLGDLLPDALFTFELPTACPASALVAMSLRINWKGPSVKESRWQWSILNVTRWKQVVLGKNSKAPSWTWWSAEFPVPGPMSSFVLDPNRIQIRQTCTRGSSASCDLDSLVLALNCSTCVMVTPSPSPSPVLSPTVSPKPTRAATRSRAPRPTATAAATPTLTASPTATRTASPTRALCATTTVELFDWACSSAGRNALGLWSMVSSCEGGAGVVNGVLILTLGLSPAASVLFLAELGSAPHLPLGLASSFFTHILLSVRASAPGLENALIVRVGDMAGGVPLASLTTTTITTGPVPQLIAIDVTEAGASGTLSLWFPAVDSLGPVFGNLTGATPTYGSVWIDAIYLAALCPDPSTPLSAVPTSIAVTPGARHGKGRST